MTVDLVTRSEVKRALHIDHTDDDAMLDMHITAASEAVVNHLKAAVDPYLDEFDEIDVAEIPTAWKTATIMLVGYFYRSPDQDAEKEFEGPSLPRPVVALLHPYRDPALA